MDHVFILVQGPWYFGGPTQIVGVFLTEEKAYSRVQKLEKEAKELQLRFDKQDFSLKRVNVE